MLPAPFPFATDTATLLVCDPAALSHRLKDEADWWCWPPEEQLGELNPGRAAFVELGEDGVYEVAISFVGLMAPDIEFELTCPSGQLFVGAGEEAPCKSGSPQCVRGGTFAIVRPGAVTLTLKRDSGNKLRLGVVPSAKESSNYFQRPLELR